MDARGITFWALKVTFHVVISEAESAVYDFLVTIEIKTAAIH